MDRLIADLWSEPPPTAAKVVQGYVSQLRRVLPPETLLTHSGGYVLRLDETDAERFARLVEEAAREPPRRAASILREALALWRGPALAGFEYEEWAQPEIARLDELRALALEARIDADLDLGRERELVPELEALVLEEPLRERLRGQLMLALYRRGRQAEALEVFREARAILLEELGVEPGPHLQQLQRAILEHDAGLRPPPQSGWTNAVPRPVWRHPIAVGVAGAAVIATAASVAVWRYASGSSPVARSGVVVVDPASGRIRTSIPLGRAPAAVAVGEGRVWVLDGDDKTLSEIDPVDERLVRTFGTSSTPTDVAFGHGSLWVGNGFVRSEYFGTSFPASVSRLDPETSGVVATIRLPLPAGSPYFQGGGGGAPHIAVSDDAVWAINPDRTLSRIDPRTNRRVARIRGIHADAIAASGPHVWALEASGVAEISSETDRVVRRIPVAAESLTTLTLGAGSIWLADPVGGSVWRVQPSPKPVLRQIPLDFGVAAVSYAAGAVWATDAIHDTLYRIDPLTNALRPVDGPPAPTAVAATPTGVWVATLGRAPLDAPLPAASCSPLEANGIANPDVILVSDLPLQGDVQAFTRPMVDAVRFVLTRHHFRAGGYTVGYHSCDDSTAQAGSFDIYRCALNARAYARRPRIVAIIGPYNSPCASFQIGTANQAAEGPLAMLSPANTFTGLTRSYSGLPRSELTRLYPTGQRNYFRIATADHLASAALATFATELQRRRIFVAWDGLDGYSAAFAAQMQRAAVKHGATVVGAAGWNPRATSFRGLAGQVRDAGADALLLAGAHPIHLAAMMRDLRLVLGDSVAIIANDGFADDAALRAAGRAANGLYVGNYGVPNEKLPPRGAAFLRRFSAQSGSTPSSFTATYAAQATEVVLNAIARSDGSRAAVTRALARTRIRNGLIGPIRFDAYGDLVDGPVTIFRIARGHRIVDRVVVAHAADTR